MSTRLSKLILGLFLALFIFVSVAAQDDCPAIVETALTSAHQWCAALDRNQACYGNNAVAAQLQPAYEDVSFTRAGDIVDVIGIQGMQLSAMDITAGTWGVALFRIQANLPDTLPGQNVMMLMFGDTEIYPADPPSPHPMQAFYMRTGIGDAACAEVPNSGLLVQTPQGVGQIALSINNVAVQMGSTVYFQAQASGNMTIRTVEGAARVQVGDDIETAIAGTEVNLPLDENLIPSAPPEDPESYEEEVVAALPIALLEREIEIEPPLSDEELERFLEYEEAFEAIQLEHQGELLDYLVKNGGGNSEALLTFLTDELGYEEAMLTSNPDFADLVAAEQDDEASEFTEESSGETNTDDDTMSPDEANGAEAGEPSPGEDAPPEEDASAREDPGSADVAWGSGGELVVGS
jgi:hypothetical protein